MLAYPMHVSEALEMSDVEKKRALETVIDHNNGRLSVIAHVSSPGTDNAVGFARHARGAFTQAMPLQHQVSALLITIKEVLNKGALPPCRSPISEETQCLLSQKSILNQRFLKKFKMHAAVKALLEMQGLPMGLPRQPNLPLNPNEKEALVAALQEIGVWPMQRWA